MTKEGHMIKVEAIIGTIRSSEVGVTIQIIGIEVGILEVIEGT